MSVIPGNEQHEHPRISPKLSWKSKSRALAEEAAAAALRLPGVLGAAFAISGPPTELVLHVDCRLRPNQDPAATMKLIADSVVEDLERAIGIRFFERHLDFHIAESFPVFHEAPAAAVPFGDRLTQGAPPLSVAS